MSTSSRVRWKALVLGIMQIQFAFEVASLFPEFFALAWSQRNLSRFLLLTLIFAGGLVSRAAEPKLQAVSDSPYRLHFVHTHTGEHLNIVYRDDAGYDQESLERLNRYLRDHRTGEIHEYDPRVFDLLHDLTTALGNPNLEIDVVCGYRTPWSNELHSWTWRGPPQSPHAGNGHRHPDARDSHRTTQGRRPSAASWWCRLLRRIGFRARGRGARPTLVV